MSNLENMNKQTIPDFADNEVISGIDRGLASLSANLAKNKDKLDIVRNSLFGKNMTDYEDRVEVSVERFAAMSTSESFGYIAAMVEDQACIIDDILDALAIHTETESK